MAINGQKGMKSRHKFDRKLAECEMAQNWKKQRVKMAKKAKITF